MASAITPSETSTSIVIHPDPGDQITCGKTPIKTINDVVFTTRTLPNGKRIDLSMDVQMPDTPGIKPLVVYVTGGGFIQAPKESALDLRTYVAEAGFAVASVQYRTIGDSANYRDGISDVKSAIRYLRANADKYGIDAKKVAVWGESAGGYLVAMVGVTNGIKTFDVGNDLDQSSDVQAVIDKFGASDISKLSADFDSHAQEANNAKDNPVAQYIGLQPGNHLLDTPVATTVANPLTYISSADPPFLIFHGSRDTLVSPSQTLILHNALIAAGAHSTRYVLEGAGHGDLSFLGDSKSGLPWSTNQTMGLIVAFLGSSIGTPAVAGAPAEDIHLYRIQQQQNILPDQKHAGFGSLLYDEHGELVLHDGSKTWLYTTTLFESPSGGKRDWYGKWVSYVREFDIKTHESGPQSLALGLAGQDRWAVIHDVLQVSEHLFVAFYSANGAIRAATSTTPDGLFETSPSFRIEVTDDWERKGGLVSSLESNGAHVLIEDTGRLVTLWLGYDSYHVDATAGQLGWAKIRIDKETRTVAFVEKHSQNPIHALPDNYLAARCGGNLSSSLRLNGQHVLFYYSRPNKEKIMLTVALSDDPLFQHITKIIEIEPPLSDEQVIEKFESYVVGKELHLIYENQLASGHWGTGMRVYKIQE